MKGESVSRRRLLKIVGMAVPLTTAGCIESVDEEAQRDEQTTEEQGIEIEFNDIRIRDCGPVCKEVQIITTVTNQLDVDVESISLELDVDVTTSILGREPNIYWAYKDIDELPAGASQQVEFIFEPGPMDFVDAVYRGDCDFEYEVKIEYVKTGGVYRSEEETHQGEYEMECDFP